MFIKNFLSPWNISHCFVVGRSSRGSALHIFKPPILCRNNFAAILFHGVAQPDIHGLPLTFFTCRNSAIKQAKNFY